MLEKFALQMAGIYVEKGYIPEFAHSLQVDNWPLSLQSRCSAEARSGAQLRLGWVLLQYLLSCHCYLLVISPCHHKRNYKLVFHIEHLLISVF